MGAAPATHPAPAVRGFRNAEIADGIVYHDRAGAEFGGQSHSSSLVSCPDAGRQRKR